MSESEALYYQVSHHQIALIAFSKEFGVQVQITLMMMSIYR